MIVKCKNPDLYRAWLMYFSKSNLKDYEQRAYAYFNSQAGKPVPLTR